MSYTIDELNPQNPILSIDDKRLEVSLITLQKEVEFIEKFGSTQKALTELQTNPEIIIEIIYTLLVKKISMDKFHETIFSSKEKTLEVGKKMSLVLTEVVEKSMPLIKNKQRYKEIQQLKESKDAIKPCYGNYFDAVAKRYGYTLEKFMQLTIRQLHIILKVIGERAYEELEVKAALAGKKLKPQIKFDDISVEQDKENEDEAMEAFKRLQQNYQNKQKKNKDK